MKGLALARRYFEATCDQLLAPFPALRTRIAAGMVGPGSECFGFDDEYSKDHDYGPGYCIWLSDEDHAHYGQALQAQYDALPTDFAGFSGRNPTARSGQRVGVFSISGFYSQFLGAPELPVSDADWLQIPEELLATAINGEVFIDGAGAFSRIREALKNYYPEQIQRLKIATAMANMAQSGQYNLPRALARKEWVTARLAQAEFLKHTCLLVYALNKSYAPFYKWLHRGIRQQPILSGLYDSLNTLADTPIEYTHKVIEGICTCVLNELIIQGYTHPGDTFLENHVNTILQR